VAATQADAGHFLAPPGGCSEVKVTTVAPDHYKVESTQQVGTGGYYLLLKLTGLKGRAVTIDLCGAPFDGWGCPVGQYGYVSDLGQLAGFESPPEPATQPAAAASLPVSSASAPVRPEYRARPRTGDLAALPDTSRQAWHFFSGVHREPGTLALKQTFTEDTAYLAFRVPYTPEYNQNYLARLLGNPNVEVIEIGKSNAGRPLQLVKTRGTSEDETRKPCVLIYAREHCDEQDSSWIAQGAIDFLASNDPQAQALREQCTFLVVPLLDPDGAVAGVHAHIISGFGPGDETPDSLLYAAWFKKWVDEGKRLDIALNLHNPPLSAAFHVACPMMEPELERLGDCMALHASVRGALTAAGYQVRNTPWTTGHLTPRLCGWLAKCFGTLPLPYEVNSATPKRQLNLAEVRGIGRAMVLGSAQFVSSDPGKTLLAQVDEVRQRRSAGWTAMAGRLPAGNPIAAEVLVAQNVSLAAKTIGPASAPAPPPGKNIRAEVSDAPAGDTR